ncbi:MAG TPA: hypothetical protein VGY66_12110 [Gemmataceae bacterium]|jgi:hypothetical protein|nr:hypothetical protein [Gemmataceae bacterium]
MSQFRRWEILLIVPALAYILATTGCGSDKGKDVPRGSSSNTRSTTVASNTGSSGVEAGAFEAKGTGTLKGKVTYDGTPPTPVDLTPEMEKKNEPDKSHCLKGRRQEELWMVSGDKGVANVIVWLEPPAGTYFKVPAGERKPDVEISQPFCQFIPHVAAINPSEYDPDTKKQKKTGQQLKVINNAPIAHNTAYKGNPLLNPGTNQNLPSKGEMPVPAKPCRDSDFGKADLLNFNCDIHKWMTAKVAVFDHPFYAVTKEDGTYEIKNAPAGAELTIRYWHESMDPTSLKGAKSKAVTLKTGDNTEDFKVKQ